jgi:enoyl-CoA hydratase/carnithine racemase
VTHSVVSNDLGDFFSDPPSDTDSPAFRFLHAISTVRKVLVAAVHGAVVGVSTTMLLHSDLVIAARGARLSLPFISLGLVPEAASTVLPLRAVCDLRAAEALLLGEPIDADCVAMGARQPRRRGQNLDRGCRRAHVADQLFTPLAVRLSKQLLKDDPAGIALRIEQEGVIFVSQLRGPEFRDAGTAFLEKRPVDFSRF